jgi:hypothetical protein
MWRRKFGVLYRRKKDEMTAAMRHVGSARSSQGVISIVARSGARARVRLVISACSTRSTWARRVTQGAANFWQLPPIGARIPIIEEGPVM